MKFNRWDLGQRKAGDIVTVTLRGSAANVRLMGSSDFNRYKAGESHQYIGGLAERSLIRLRIPNSGQWYVTVDMAGLRGEVRAAVQVTSAS